MNSITAPRWQKFKAFFTIGMPPKQDDKRSFLAGAWSLRPTLIILSVVAALALIGYATGYFEDALNFSKQAWTFGVAMVTFLIFGLNLGYLNSYKRNVWTFTDLLWISMTLFALSRMLAPVESFIFNGRIRNAAIISATHYEGIVQKTKVSWTVACKNVNQTKLCSQWKSFQQTVLATGVAPDNITNRVDVALQKVPLHPDTDRIRGEIEWSRDQLKKSRAEEADAKKVAMDINILWPYINLFLLIAALGLRAGKTGAEFARNRMDREKDLVTKATKDARDADEKGRSTGDRNDWR